jgi:hypothetical protein
MQRLVGPSTRCSKQETSRVAADPVARPARSTLTGIEREARTHTPDVFRIRSQRLGQPILGGLDVVPLENNARRGALVVEAIDAQIVA